MPGIKVLSKIQLGRETVAGTAVAATTIWRGNGRLADNRRFQFVEEDIGYISGVDRSYVDQLGGAIAFESIPATFEQLPHILEAGVKTATPVQDGAGTDYIYTYTFPTTSKNTLKTYTIEAGDDQEAEEMEYGFVSDFKLEGEGGGAVMMSANWRGRQVVVSTFTPALALPTVKEILFSRGKLYIDAIGGTIGTTLKSNTLLKMALNVTTGWQPVFAADGQLYFSFAKLTRPVITLDLTFEHDAISAAEKVKWRAGTPIQLRLLFEDDVAFGTPGTTYTYRTLKIDLIGKWHAFDALADQDGNDVLVGHLTARYNSTAAKYAEIVDVIELATLP